MRSHIMLQETHLTKPSGWATVKSNHQISLPTRIGMSGLKNQSKKCSQKVWEMVAFWAMLRTLPHSQPAVVTKTRLPMAQLFLSSKSNVNRDWIDTLGISEPKTSWNRIKSPTRSSSPWSCPQSMKQTVKQDIKKHFKNRADSRSSDTQHYTTCRYHILAMVWQSLMTFLRRWQEHPSALGHSGYCWHKCVHSWPQREHQCLGHRFFRAKVDAVDAEDATRSGTVATHMETFATNAAFDVWNRHGKGRSPPMMPKCAKGRPSKGVLCPGNISGACTRSPRALLHFTTKIREFHEISEVRSVSASWLPQEAPVSQGSSNKLKHHPVLIQSQFLHKKHPMKLPIRNLPTSANHFQFQLSIFQIRDLFADSGVQEFLGLLFLLFVFFTFPWVVVMIPQEKKEGGNEGRIGATTSKRKTGTVEKAYGRLL